MQHNNGPGMGLHAQEMVGKFKFVTGRALGEGVINGMGGMVADGGAVHST